MEPTNKSFVGRRAKPAEDVVAVEFLPDADEIERSPIPPFAQITVRVMLCAFAAFLLWATLSTMDEVVVAQGKLVTPLPNVVVQPLETSVIQSINVRQGQIVHKGEELATLDPTFAQADEAQLRLRLRSLDTQTNGLQAELSGAAAGGNAGDADSVLQAQLVTERKANYAAQLDKMQQNIARLEAALQTNRHDAGVLEIRVKSLREIEAMQEKLVAQNYGARLHLLEAQDKRLEVERDLSRTRNQERELQRELAAAQAEKSAFSKSWRQKTMEELLTTRRDRDSLNEQLNKADMRRRLVSIKAPVDGVVLEIAKLSPGSIVKEAETFFTLVPLNAPLEAEVQIDSLDVGYIKPGDRAHLKVDAFPFQRHGGLEAKVRTVSQDSFQRQTQPLPGAGTNAYYLSRITFGAAQLKNMSKHSKLLPGMTLNAEIVVGRRSVISYLMWPLTKALQESLREP